jgi:GWxTD domain-containing protein
MRIFTSLIILSFLTALPGFSQGPERPPGPGVTPKFYFEALSFSANESGVERLDVLVEIPYEALQFIKEGDNFTSRCEITITVYDSSETLVNEKFWRETIRVKDYEKTVSSSVCYVNQKTFFLVPRAYIVSVVLKDMETDIPVRLKKKINVRPYAGSRFAISDIMLVSRIEMDSTNLVVTPNISGAVGGNLDSFCVYFDVYNNLRADSAAFSLIMRNIKGAIVQSDTFGRRITESPQGVYKFLKTKALIAGEYILELIGYPIIDSARETAKSEMARVNRQISIRWRGMPLSVSDLDLAIEQLIYIADREQIEEMRRAMPEMKRDLFQKFWKTKDPTPQTERNEIMEEYYSRVLYANTHFSYYLEGWKTDMGMIYILFGAPSNIERHPFEMNTKPYEIWSYYEQNREFIFIDISGFGEYRLQNTDWDVRDINPR